MTGASAPASIGWGRAIITSLVILGLIVVLFAYAPNLALTKLGAGRHVKVAVATLISTVSLVALAFALRRLQRRRII